MVPLPTTPSVETTLSNSLENLYMNTLCETCVNTLSGINTEPTITTTVSEHTFTHVLNNLLLVLSLSLPQTV